MAAESSWENEGGAVAHTTIDPGLIARWLARISTWQLRHLVTNAMRGAEGEARDPLQNRGPEKDP